MGRVRSLGEVRRHRNEKLFDRWEDLPDSGRRYYHVVMGRAGWLARYNKEVDADEQTRRFWQEIYDEAGGLREVHEKYPVDTGHRKVEG